MASHDPREIELKFEIDPTDVTDLKSVMLPAIGEGGTTSRLVSVYYDTAKKDLHANGMSLRVRTVDGGGRVQTVKASKGAGAGLFDRAEWETQLDGKDLDWAAITRTPAAALLPGGCAELKPLFETVVRRSIWTADTKRSSIEIALDEGEVTAGQARKSIAELEIELKRGRINDLFRFVRKLRSVPSLRPGVQAKSERGYSLLGKKAPKAFKAEPIALLPDMTAGEAFQQIMLGCLRQFRLNEPLVVDGRKAEPLHQARVAMRRLRSALSLFGPVIADKRLAGLKARLRDVSRHLGEARNLDVYLEQSARPDVARDGADPGGKAFLAEMERRRNEAYDAIAATLASEPFRVLLLDLLEWIEAGPWLSDRDPLRTAVRDRPIRSFAAEVLQSRRRAVKRKGKHVADLDPHARHRVRIAAKKLRYAANFFAGLATSDTQKERHAAFVSSLADLQEHLGALNDIQTGHEIALGFAQFRPTTEPAVFSAAHVSGAQDARIDDLLQQATAAHTDVSRAKRFWRKWA